MPSPNAEIYDTTHVYDAGVAYDGSWATVTNTPTGFILGTLAQVEIKSLPAGVSLADGSFFPYLTVVKPNASGTWSAFLAESGSFSDPTQYYQIQEVYYDGHRNTYKVRVPATAGTPTWKVVQSASIFDGALLTSLPVSYPNPVTAGNKLITFVALGFGGGSQSPSSVIDANNNQQTQLAVFQGVDNVAINLSMWGRDVPVNDVGTKPTITVTITTACFSEVVIQEVSGLLPGTTASLDGTPGFSHGGNAVTTSPVYSSTGINEYLLAVYGDAAGSGFTGPTGYTLDPNSVNQSSNDLGVSYKASTRSAESDNYSSAGSNGWVQMLGAFKVATPGRVFPVQTILI